MATIITKNSQTASAVPAASSLEVGELAVNTADGKLYTEHTGGIVKEIIPSTVVDGGITAAKIATNAVTSDKINANAVTTAKIADANVTIAKLSATGTPSSSTFLRGDGTWGSAGGGASGQAAQLFTSSGTFTVPAGVTAVKVTVVGGGGGGGGSWTQNGGSGGTTSFGAFVSATGGGGGGTSPNGNSNGGGGGSSAASFFSTPGFGGSSGSISQSGYNTIYNAGVGANPSSPYITGTRGKGGDGTSNGAGGGAGGTGTTFVTGLTPGGTVSVTIGAAGSSFGSAAVAGACLIEW